MLNVSQEARTAASAPHRCVRIRAEILDSKGKRVTVEGREIVELELRDRFDPSGLTAPCSNCRLTLAPGVSTRWTSDQLLEVRIYLGLQLPDGRIIWEMMGLYRPDPAGGVESRGERDPELLRLVDLPGYLADRTFRLPSGGLPSSLGGWLDACVASAGLSPGSVELQVDPAVRGVSVTAARQEDIVGKRCGALLASALMAAGAALLPDWSHDRLYVTRIASSRPGTELSLSSLSAYPAKKSGAALSEVVFNVYTSAGRSRCSVGGSDSNGVTTQVDNPFVHDSAQATEITNTIIRYRGGDSYELVGRGDPATELGDMDTVPQPGGEGIKALRVAQSYSYKGILSGCKANLITTVRKLKYETYQIIRSSQSWTVPKGVTRIRLVLGQGGQGGTHGEPGWAKRQGNRPSSPYTCNDGRPGTPGQGGMVWMGFLDVHEGDTLQINIGAGGAPAGDKSRFGADYPGGIVGGYGGHTTVGGCSSANGKHYNPAYVDSGTGQTFCKAGKQQTSIASWYASEDGPPAPPDGSGNGGDGGYGGQKPTIELVEHGGSPSSYEETIPPGKGTHGARGGSGFAIIFWDKEDAT